MRKKAVVVALATALVGLAAGASESKAADCRDVQVGGALWVGVCAELVPGPAGTVGAEVGFRCYSLAGKPCNGGDGMMVLGPTGFSPNPALPTCVDAKRASFTVGPGVAGTLWVDGAAQDVVIPKIGTTQPSSYC